MESEYKDGIALVDGAFCPINEARITLDHEREHEEAMSWVATGGHCPSQEEESNDWRNCPVC